MGFDAARIAIESRLQDNLAKNIPIKFDNVLFKYPSDNSISYVAITILSGQGEQIAMSPKRHRQIGIISCQVFSPEDSGTKRAGEIADLISAIFQSQQFSGITCRTTSIFRVGNVEGKYQISVNTPFFRDETTT